MNILLLGSRTSSKDRINSYSSMQAYFLEYFFKKFGVNVFFHSTQNANNHKIFVQDILMYAEENSINHIVALGVNFFGKADNRIGYNLTKNFSGMVTQIHDCSTLDSLFIDLNFAIKNDEWRFLDNSNNRLTRHLHCNHTIGWAADRDIFYPRQVKDRTLRIFVDHTNFTDAHVDYSLTIFMSLIRLKNLIKTGKIPEYDNVIVKTLTDNGIEVLDLNDISVKPYHRKSVPVQEFAQELASSDIFFVTHAESIGLCVLESAMSGVLVFAPIGTINENLLEKVNHVSFSSAINWNDWAEIAAKLTPEKNSLIVQKYNWETLSLNLLEGLLKFKKRDADHAFPIL